MYSQKRSGFTLIELLIVMFIMGGLAMIAYPSYVNFLLKAHRTDALITLTQEQVILEQCYAQNKSYAKDCAYIPHYPHSSSQGYYLINTVKRDATSYTLKATATGSQAQDQHCTQFIVDQINKKAAMDAVGTMHDDCWSRG